jgi:N-acetylglutamate synthase-like GNAT family acetyltransferase
MTFQWSDLPSIPKETLVVPGVLGDVVLRSYQPCDRRRALWLYKEGLLTPTANPAGSAAELGQIEEVYLKRPQDHFWVAEMHGDVIAMVGVKEEERQIGHVRRLRVDPTFVASSRRELAQILLRKAAEHAREHEFLKLVLHKCTAAHDEEAAAFLHQLGFEFNRARELDGRHLLEFYLNFYEQIQPPQGQSLRD